MDEGWIKHPKLWAKAQEEVAKTEPLWTKAFWKKVMSLYKNLGGKVEDDPIEDPVQGSSLLDA